MGVLDGLIYVLRNILRKRRERRRRKRRGSRSSARRERATRIEKVKFEERYCLTYDGDNN